MPIADKQALMDAVPKLSAGDAKFARSLLQAWDRYHGLTQKQAAWAEKLVDRAVNPPKQPSAVSIGDFSGVMTLFATAATRLKFPRVRLIVDGQPIQLSLAGPNSKAPGMVNVTDGERYGSNKWFGRVAPTGEWSKGRDATPAIEDFLRKFSASPAKVAAEYGKLTGYCCFCGRSLSDEHSTAVGYGPVCAENFGLLAEWKAARAVLEAA